MTKQIIRAMASRRRELGWSWYKTAKDTKFSPHQVKNWLTEKHCPSLNNACLLAEKLGLYLEPKELNSPDDIEPDRTPIIEPDPTYWMKEKINSQKTRKDYGTSTIQ